jgi:hypothetical protein
MEAEMRRVITNTAELHQLDTLLMEGVVRHLKQFEEINDNGMAERKFGPDKSGRQTSQYCSRS